MVKIYFSKTNETVETPSGTELLQLYKNYPYLPLKFGCTKGECGICMVKIHANSNQTSRCTRAEQTKLKDRLKENYRLACQCAILDSVQID